MKKIFLIILALLAICYGILYSKEMVSIKCINSSDTCKYEPNIWFLDLNNDDKFDACLYRTCGGVISSQNLRDNSTVTLNNDMTAVLVNGLVETKKFLYYIYDPGTNTILCKLYYDNNYQGSVLADYSGRDDQTISNEEADEYFYTQQFGGIILITKKTDINVQSVMLCSIDGKIITYLQNVEGWGQFLFNLSEQPSGMYLIRFIATDKALTKKVVYIR